MRFLLLLVTALVPLAGCAESDAVGAYGLQLRLSHPLSEAERQDLESVGSAGEVRYEQTLSDPPTYFAHVERLTLSDCEALGPVLEARPYVTNVGACRLMQQPVS